MSRRYLPLCLLCIPLILTACGGGGGGGDTNPPPAPASSSSAGNDTAVVTEDSSVQVNVTANDTNVTPNSVSIIRAPSNGTATTNAGTVTYTPNDNFAGTDSLDYSVNSSNNSGNNTATLSLTINSVNDAPVASDDAISTDRNTSFELDVLLNDSDVDDDTASLSIAIIDGTNNGSIAIVTGGLISYAPLTGFSGSDSFTYQVTDLAGAISNIATVSITVLLTGQSNIVVQDIVIPTTGYISENVAEFGQLMQVSPAVNFTVTADTISFAASLIGPSVLQFNSLIIVDIRNPQGIVFDRKDGIFCDLGLCTIQVPKRPEISTDPGVWTLRLGTFATSIDQVSLAAYSLQLASRIGVAPAPTDRIRLDVKPFLTGSLSPTLFDQILDRFATMADLNDISVTIEPLTVLSEQRFAQVSSDFRDSDTADLVRMGDADKINLFFIEGFSDPDGAGLLGIAGGIPGSIGIATEYNGVLLSGTATDNLNIAIHRRTTAEFALHELSHLLGLYHTTESDFSDHDVLVDTVECLENIHDTVADGQANADECPDGLNVMFWENDLFSAKELLTPDQKTVLRNVPVSDLMD